MADPFAPPHSCPASWKHRPCIMRISPFAPDVRTLDESHCGNNLPMNESGFFRFDSSLFTGIAHVRVAGTSDVPNDYFNGKRRRMQAVIQGQFKTEMGVAEVYTGQALNRPLKGVPHQAIVKAVQKVVQTLSPGVLFDVASERPHAVSLLAATAQTFDVSVKGDEPCITSDIQEKNQLLGDAFVSSAGMTAAQRKKFFSTASNAVRYTYRKDLVYTFDFYQDRMDVASWSLDLGVKRFKLINHLNRQPVQVMAMTLNREWLYNFEIWHEKLLDGELVKKCEETPDDDGELTKQDLTEHLTPTDL